MGRILTAIASLVFVFGLSGTLSEQPQGPENRQTNPAAQQEKRAHLSAAPAPQNQPPSSPKYRNPCQNGGEREDADLCAQWAAADAATDQNFIAIGVAGATLIVGVLAVAVAAMAVRQTHTSQRPYVYFHLTKKTRRGRGRKIVSIDGVTFRNAGKTSARVVGLTVRHKLCRTPPDPRSVEMERYPPSAAIFPDEDWPLKGHVPVAQGGTVLREPAVGSDDHLFCYGVMVYRDAFDKAYEVWFCRVFVNGSFAFAPNKFPELELQELNGTRKLRFWQYWRVKRRAVARTA